MNTRSVAILSLFAGALLGGAAIQGLHAQSKAPVYVVAEMNPRWPEGFLFFAQNYGSKIRELIKSHGGRVVALGGGPQGYVTAIEGEPPEHAAVQVWDSMDQLQAYRNDPQFKELRTIGEKYVRFYSYAIDGLSE